jgi:hypothetical protein
MQATLSPYAKIVEKSRRIRWDIDRDVIRGRVPSLERKWLPDALAAMDRFDFLDPAEKKFMSQVQGRTYANMFGLVERFIGAKMLEVSRHHWLGDQVALEALVRLTDEELKHQELFRRLEVAMAACMPEGYRFMPQPNDVAAFVLGKSTWAVLGLTCHIELFSQEHYRQSIDHDPDVSELWKDVFMFHWKEESQHALVDELEWAREHERLGEAQRDAAVDDLIALVGGVDGLLQVQAAADADYFMAAMPSVSRRYAGEVKDGLLAAYRWQYIVSGARNERFGKMLGALATPAQMARIGAALAPLAPEKMAA